MKRGLGRGLDELLRGASSGSDAAATSGAKQIAVGKLKPGKHQPRRRFEESELHALTNSIRQRGIIQPIIVRPAGNEWEIVAGERRWRAAQAAGLSEVPVVARKLSDKEAMLFALVENIQRADLNPVEQARGIETLLQETKMTHEQAASHLGMSRPAVSNFLRLLSLSPPVLKLLEEGKLESAHARALLPLSGAQQIALAKQIIAQNLSVRETEQLVRRASKPTRSHAPARVNADTVRLEAELSAALSAKVKIQHSGKSGKLLIHYSSLDALDRLIKRLRK